MRPSDAARAPERPLPEVPAGRRGYLLLRRQGGVWGVANHLVTSLGRSAGGDGVGGNGAAYRVGTAAEPLAADEILGVAADLDVRRPARAVARWWPEGSDGCALWSGLPVAVIDPRHPPRALRLAATSAEGEAGGDGGEPNDGD
jgi:hypothetical protein